jgi:ribosomal protein S27AE
MQTDPLVEWQRLTELYSKMYDGELLNLAADSVDLTETARQALDGEMRKRGLELPRAASNAPEEPDRPRATQWGPRVSAPQIDAPGSATAGQAAPHDFTWKTLLCECGDNGEAWQLCEALRQAGIESWIDGPQRSYPPLSDLDMRSPRVLVAADQLDQARLVAAKPIQGEIVGQSKTQPPEFEPPVCPSCGAGDPLLEGVDPVNSWQCGACGREWTEPIGDLAGTQERAG